MSNGDRLLLEYEAQMASRRHWNSVERRLRVLGIDVREARRRRRRAQRAYVGDPDISMLGPRDHLLG
jgi:hypothetical protein